VGSRIAAPHSAHWWLDRTWIEAAACTYDTIRSSDELGLLDTSRSADVELGALDTTVHSDVELGLLDTNRYSGVGGCVASTERGPPGARRPSAGDVERELAALAGAGLTPAQLH
jgi:hypothetical protein